MGKLISDFTWPQKQRWPFRNKTFCCQLEEIASAFRRPFQTSSSSFNGQVTIF